MKTTLSSQYHDYNSWLNKLSLYGDEIVIMQQQLETVHEKNVMDDARKTLEYFQNQILTLRINTETMWYHLKHEAKELNDAIKKNRFMQRNDLEHQGEFELVEKFENNFNHLRKEFHSFINTWIHQEKSYKRAHSISHTLGIN